MNSGKAVTSNRIDYLDFLKGIAILLVVANHTSPYWLRNYLSGEYWFLAFRLLGSNFQTGCPSFSRDFRIPIRYEKL